MSYLRLFAYSSVQHKLCFVFLRLVYPMLPVSLDCSFLIAPSVFSNVLFWTSCFRTCRSVFSHDIIKMCRYLQL